MRNYENFGSVLSRYITAGDLFEDQYADRVREDAIDWLRAMSKEILLPSIDDVAMDIGLSGLETLVFHAKYEFGGEHTNVTITIKPSLVDMISVSCSVSGGFPPPVRESICVAAEEAFYEFMTRYA